MTNLLYSLWDMVNYVATTDVFIYMLGLVVLVALTKFIGDIIRGR